MDFFAFIPSLLCLFVSVSLYVAAENDEEKISKLWCFIFFILLSWLTIFFADMGMKYSNSTKVHQLNNNYINKYY